MGVDRIAGFARVSAWRGRSGRVYALTPEAVAEFFLSPEKLYLLARGSLALWVGGADDLVADSVSRARFRLALDCADRAYRLEGVGGDDIARMTTIWDLEGGEPELSLSAA